MNEESLLNLLDKLSESAFRYGPAFFALLFLLFLVRTTSQEYQKVVVRKEPKPEASEKGLYAGLLISSWTAGIILVAVSVWYFLFTHQTKHTVEVVILGLDPTAVIEVQNGYSRSVTRRIDATRSFQDFHIAILRDKPFKKGDRFQLGYLPEQKASGSGAPPPFDQLLLELDGADRGVPYFKVAGVPGKFQLVRQQ
jgi:hypothetical protein